MAEYHQREQWVHRATATGASGGGIVPLTRTCVLDADQPVAVLHKLARAPFAFLFESMIGGERWARYTFLGTEPREAWRYRGRVVERWTPGAGWQPAGATYDPLGHIGDVVRRHPAMADASLPRFIGGAVGYAGYDVVRTLEKLPGGPVADLAAPDALFMIADMVLVLDNLFGRATIVASVDVPPNPSDDQLQALHDAASKRIDEWLARLGRPASLAPLSLDLDVAPAEGTSPSSPAVFTRGVSTLLEHIAAGDIFQAVLSRRVDVDAAVDPLLLYRYLRALNPAPYLYHLALDDFAIVGSSPEVLVRVEDGEVTVRPIAGTRPRGATPALDRALEAELLADPKELAEHRMLVDLGRNDVGRVAAFGTVRVVESEVIERYAHVMHLVSEVKGALGEGKDSMDALKACFPAGTVSGAPKIRAMELLDGLESVRRGPYAGAVGYIGWGAEALDTAITIRTCVVTKDKVYVQAGAGIVADSVPDKELAEAEAKARAPLRAVALARGSAAKPR